MSSPTEREAAITPERVRAVRRKTTLADGALLGLVVLLTVVAAVAAWTLYSTAENRYVKEAFPIRYAVRDTLVQMLNEETGVRGYLITAHRSSLQPYRAASSALTIDLSTLRQLAATRPEIAPDVSAAGRQIRLLDAFYRHQIALVASGRAGQLEAQRNVFAGKARFDRFRQTSNRLILRANAIVSDAHASQRRTFWTTLAVVLVAGTAAALIALWLLLSVPRRIWSLYDVERDLREEAERGGRASRSLAHIDDAVILLDLEGTIGYWNRAAEQLVGVSEEEALGRHLEVVVPELATLQELLERNRDVTIAPLARQDGERWLLARESRFAEGRVIVLKDVTAERQLERTRSDFLATASHELRTPLAAVYGAARTLRRADRPANAELDDRLLAMIESESDRLKEIVEQILTSAEVDVGEIRLRRELIGLRELCESAIAAARARAPDGVSFALEASDELTIEADQARLRQVVINLLDNAAKYSPGGGVVDVSIEARPGAVAIRISDKGIGIPHEAQERIFEKFVRLDPQMKTGVGGNGLGLYISRELVALMDGRLRVESQPGEGSTFTVELPR